MSQVVVSKPLQVPENITNFPKIVVPQTIVEPVVLVVNETNIDNQNIVNPIISLDKEKKVSAFSIASIGAKKILQDQSLLIVKDEVKLPQESFAEHDMQLLWKNYAIKQGEVGKKIMESLLLINEPKLLNNQIVLELPNQGSQIDFETEKPPLLRYLQQKLNNYSIDIKVVINENYIQKVAITDNDKYNRLLDINVNLDLLKKTFDLDY